MEKEINDIIKKNLPAEVGSILKQRLEQAETDAETVESQKRQLKENSARFSDLNEQILAYQKLDERNSKLEERERAVENKERSLEIETLKYQLASEKDKTDFSHKVALGLVRNVEYRKNIFDSENAMGYYDQQGKWVEPRNESKSHTEEKKAE